MSCDQHSLPSHIIHKVFTQAISDLDLRFEKARLQDPVYWFFKLLPHYPVEAMPYHRRFSSLLGCLLLSAIPFLKVMEIVITSIRRNKK